MADAVGERRCVFLAGLYRAERLQISRLAKRTGRASTSTGPCRAVPWLESRAGIILVPNQSEALRLAAASKALVITGGPGACKTTLFNSILKMLVAETACSKSRRPLALGAPTGHAAQRLTGSTGVEAKMIHRLPEWATLCATQRSDTICLDEIGTVELIVDIDQPHGCGRQLWTGGCVAHTRHSV